jgi:hypothetical protein
MPLQSAQRRGQEPAQGQIQERALSPSRRCSPSSLNTSSSGSQLEDAQLRGKCPLSEGQLSSAQLSWRRSSKAAAAEAKGSTPAVHRHRGTMQQLADRGMCTRAASVTNRPGWDCRWKKVPDSRQHAARTEGRRGPRHKGDGQTRTHCAHIAHPALPLPPCRLPPFSLPVRPAVVPFPCPLGCPVAALRGLCCSRCPSHRRKGKRRTRTRATQRTQREGTKDDEGLWEHRLTAWHRMRGWCATKGRKREIWKSSRGRWNSRGNQERKAIKAVPKRVVVVLLLQQSCVCFFNERTGRGFALHQRMNAVRRSAMRLGSLDGVHAHDVVGVAGCTNKQHRTDEEYEQTSPVVAENAVPRDATASRAVGRRAWYKACVCVRTEQGGSIGGPGERNALDGDGLLSGGGELGLELVDAEARLEVPEEADRETQESTQTQHEMTHSEHTTLQMVPCPSPQRCV